MAGSSILVTLVLVGACATPKQPPYGAQQAFPFTEKNRAFSSASSASSDSGEEWYGKGSKPMSVPHRGRNTDAVDLVVRPDVLAGDFAVREVRPTSQEALAAARATSAEVLERLGKTVGTILGKNPRFQPRGVAAEKVVRHGVTVGVVVTVDGQVEIDLPPDLDFWARSQVFIRLMESTATLANEVESKDEPLRSVKFESLGPAVKDPEAYRPQLTERWVAQTRAFATLAQAKDSPLALVDCAPPRSITQTRASIDEVTLQLAVTCRLDVAGGPHERSRREEGRE